MFNAPFAEVAAALNLGWLSVLLYADAVFSPAGTGNIYIVSTTRVLYALSKNRYSPKALSRVDPKTGIPSLALVIALLFGLVFLLPFPYWVSLVAVVSSATVFTYIIGPVAASVLRRTIPDANRPYRLGGLQVIAPIAFVIGSLIIYWTGWAYDWKLLVALLIGVVLYLIFSRVAPEQIEAPDRQSLRAGLWMVIYLITMLAMSYFGSARFGAAFSHSKGVIQYPWDLVVVIILALAFYYWGVASGYRTPMVEEALQQLRESPPKRASVN